jgi:hypothetical protein
MRQAKKPLLARQVDFRIDLLQVFSLACVLYVFSLIDLFWPLRPGWSGGFPVVGWQDHVAVFVLGTYGVVFNCFLVIFHVFPFVSVVLGGRLGVRRDFRQFLALAAVELALIGCLGLVTISSVICTTHCY